MAEEKTQEQIIADLQAQIAEIKGNKELDKRGTWFCCVALADEKMQMDVIRKIQGTPEVYKAIVILHDRDKKRAPVAGWDNVEAEESGDSFEMCRPHVHCLFQVLRKTSARALKNRFCGFLHFQACSDPVAYFQYMLHRDFKSSYIPTKYKYDYKDMICNCSEFLSQFLGDNLAESELDLWRKWEKTLKTYHYCVPLAMSALIKAGESALIRELRAHAFFYKSFFCGDRPQKLTKEQAEALGLTGGETGV